jgi:hypothetical protein
MRHVSRFLTTAAGVACAAGLAFAAEQTILGESLTVKDPKPGVDPSKRTASAHLHSRPTRGGTHEARR